MDEFTSLLIADDTRVVVDLLKLSVCSRAGDRGRDVLSAVLSGMGTAYPQVSDGEDTICGASFLCKDHSSSHTLNYSMDRGLEAVL